MAARHSIQLTTDQTFDVGNVPMKVLDANPIATIRRIIVKLDHPPRSAAGAIGISLDGPKVFEECEPILLRWESEASIETLHQMFRGEVWLVNSRDDDGTIPVLVQEGIQTHDPGT